MGKRHSSTAAQSASSVDNWLKKQQQQQNKRNIKSPPCMRWLLKNWHHSGIFQNCWLKWVLLGMQIKKWVFKDTPDRMRRFKAVFVTFIQFNSEIAKKFYQPHNQALQRQKSWWCWLTMFQSNEAGGGTSNAKTVQMKHNPITNSCFLLSW